MPVTLKSRLPMVAAQLRPRVGLVLAAGAERIAQGAKQRVHVLSGDLQEAIHVERNGVNEYAVVAGDDGVFYGHLEEHGTSHSAPHPFLLPAVEAERETLVAAVAATLGKL